MLKENQNNDTLLLDDVIPLEKEEIKIRISKINRKQTTMISYEDDEVEKQKLQMRASSTVSPREKGKKY